MAETGTFITSWHVLKSGGGDLLFLLFPVHSMLYILFNQLQRVNMKCEDALGFYNDLLKS